MMTLRGGTPRFAGMEQAGDFDWSKWWTHLTVMTPLDVSAGPPVSLPPSDIESMRPKSGYRFQLTNYRPLYLLSPEPIIY